MSKFGLSLAGGGGLGSYQIGVWKALREYEIDKRIDALSGTSVGILNACLIAQNDYDIAEYIWKNEIENNILSKKKMSIKNNSISSNGIFTREGLLEIMDKYLDLDIISNCKFPIYAAAVNLKTIDVVYFKLNGKSHSEIKEIMMASSAIPIIFGRQKIEGINYVDGGVEILNGDNLPLKPLYDEGCSQIIAISMYKETVIEKNDKCKVYEIIPSKNLGDFRTGAMDFSLKGARIRLEEGYKDTIKILKPIFKIGKMQAKSLFLNKKMYRDEIKNDINKKALKNELHKAIKDLNINKENFE